MPQTEDEVKDHHNNGFPSKVASWWQKFHFSGRVIMCSVLFGLGLILIGGIIFAINVDDEASKNAGDDDSSIEVPTKAPSNYVGPVVMGIGGFIVTVGVIMCLFETQVCRKKTADAKPLIPDKTEDVEAKVSESAALPSSPNSHKNHKCKSRKASSSPRKSKSKHAKSHSHEQKQTSSKSPPIVIEKTKNFMTSSEDNFLTPPNTLSEHATLKHSNSREAEIQTSSSLMKSFTSSGTWNQSTEFLTPTASYKENSLSVENSVELDEKQDQEIFMKNEASPAVYTRTEYMTPLTATEEKIQNMFAQVKNEKMGTDKEQLKEIEAAVKLSSAHGNDTSVINAEKDLNIKIESIKIPEKERPLDIVTSVVKETPEKPDQAILDAFENSKVVNEENAFSDNFSSANNITSEKFKPNKSEAEIGLPIQIHNDEKKEDCKRDIQSLDDHTSEKPSLQHDSSILHVNEAENVSKFDLQSTNENTNENNMQVDLESSVSSEETLVSHDNSMEKPKRNDDQMAEENSNEKSQLIDVPESPQDQSSSNHHLSDHQNSVTDTSETEKVGASDLSDNENPSKETNDSDEKSVEKSS